MQKCLLLAEGISFAGFPWHQYTTVLKKPARCRGASLAVRLTGEKLKTQLKIQPSTEGEALKSLGSCGGYVED